MVEFFQKSSSADMIEKVNQISLFNAILKILNFSIEKNTENQSIIIENENHSEIINLIFYSLKQMKENVIVKKQTVLYMLIKTIKNLDYLKMLKIIFLGAYKFLQEKIFLANSNKTNKDISLLNNNIFYDEIYEKINQSNFNYLSIETLINENTNSENSKLRNKTIFFKEDSKNSYGYFKMEDSEFFEEKLFELIKKCENKIIEFSHFSPKEIMQRKINILFFENFSNLFYYSNNITLKNSISNQNKDKENSFKKNEKKRIQIENLYMKNESKIIVNFQNLVKEFVQYFKICFKDFKIKYFNYDMFRNSNLILVDELYRVFKENIDQNILMKLIYLFYLKGRNLDSCILFQYIKEADYDIIYRLLQKKPENHSLHKLEFIWKIPYYEILANTYYKLKKDNFLDSLKHLMRRTSNHQIFKDHPLRKHFKIINLMKYLDYLEYSSFR